jgi:RNA polymerase-binding transcription factor DksA
MPLSKSQRAELSARLDERYALLIREVREELERSENQQYVELINRAPADIGDQSVGDALADLNLAIIDRHIREIRDIEQARGRLNASRPSHAAGPEARSAGGGPSSQKPIDVCCDCGQEIEFKRLLAYPTASRCVVCQEQRERTYAHESTPTL